MKSSMSLLILLLAGALLAQIEPVVYNVRAQQQEQSASVEILFNVKDDNDSLVYISLEGSSDAGATWNVEVRALSGDTGLIPKGEGKKILWDASRDYPSQYSANFKVRVTARDRMCPVTGDDGMAFIPGGAYHLGGTAYTVAEFCMDRWEFPNIRGNKPQVFASFPDAVDSCLKLGKRLCRDDEWTVACMGRYGNRYPYGPVYIRDRCNNEGDSVNPAGIDRLCASTFGVFDLSGNVFEWTDGEAGEKKGETAGAQPPDGAPDLLIRKPIRGGHYYLGPTYASCGDRQLEWATYRNRLTGFRCCYSFSTGASGEKEIKAP